MLSVLALLGSMSLAPPCEAAVCSCVLTLDPPAVAAPAAAASADAVFTGRVVSVRDTMIETGPDSGYRFRKVTLRADRAWKGVESRTVVVMTGQGGGDCGYPFEQGESYLVYAHVGADTSLFTGNCERTAVLSRATADVGALGEPSRHWRHRSRWFRWFHRGA